MKQEDIVEGMIAHFGDKDEVTRRELAEIEKNVNGELSKTETRVRIRNDSDNECVLFDIRHSQGLRDSFSMTWSEVLGIAEEPVVEELSEEDLAAVLRFADKSEAQWGNLKVETQTDWIQKWRDAS